ncbi:DUF4352 domain-containing protein [Catellatospora tritici]|uniref:DUF4352 domain-containing protein n=1 Tax=Catellatospora tritici TaxID=2851566 RepID=UPI001C2D8CCB|nr:DUF4352 domain-containing protein [Catellatospora tritici]MBV1848997.1 DUF4352 domain-containing protein [Catellatospora tritici]
MNKLLHRLGTVVLVAVTLAVGGWLTHLNENWSVDRPFEVRGEFAQPVSGRQFTATGVRVRCAAKLKLGEAILDTQGVWVIAKIRAVAIGRTSYIGWAALRDGQGRTYLTSDRLQQFTLNHPLQPGIPVEGEIVFEVPADAAGDLTLLLAKNPLEQEMDSMIAIPLPISDVSAVLSDPVPAPVYLPKAVA